MMKSKKKKNKPPLAPIKEETSMLDGTPAPPADAKTPSGPKNAKLENLPIKKPSETPKAKSTKEKPWKRIQLREDSMEHAEIGGQKGVNESHELSNLLKKEQSTAAST